GACAPPPRSNVCSNGTTGRAEAQGARNDDAARVGADAAEGSGQVVVGSRAEDDLVPARHRRTALLRGSLRGSRAVGGLARRARRLAAPERAGGRAGLLLGRGLGGLGLRRLGGLRRRRSERQREL